MDKLHNWINTVLIALVGLMLILVLVGGNQSVPKDSIGGVTNYDSVESAGLAIGSGCDNEDSACTGTTVTQIIESTCTLIYSDSQITASTTKAFDCAVTGVVSGDRVFVDIATSTPPGFGAWLLAGASASSTSGFVTLQIANFTGGTRNIPMAIGSSTKVRVSR